MIGKTLGHYKIFNQLGRGGMGEVYKAKDQKLGRDVAIKVLPEEFAQDTDRVARFQREAKLLASLNHPNIAAIHGLEESDGTHFLVLELIEGDTLADRLKRGAIPVVEALKLALQIAEALEAAHEKGVIHRDLKPANIKVTPDEKVKVLDFGLAKAFAGEQGEMILSDSPTLSITATEKGVILGTAAYMSPEQARGETVDKKADVWAFGVVLFEMLTGCATFEGRSVSDVLASVLKIEPEWKSLPQSLHPRIRLLLERCLKKEPKNRYSGISDARVDIQEVLADPSGVFARPVTTAEAQTRPRQMLPWIVSALVLAAILAGVAAWTLKPTPPPEPRQVMRFDYDLPEGRQFSGTLYPILAVSPDGKQFVYSTTNGLYLRSVDELKAKLIAGTEGHTLQPFFSPDGKWIGYSSPADSKLKKIDINGGTPVSLGDEIPLSGVSWGANDGIVYGGSGGIMRISANGGNPEPLVKGEGNHLYPQILPDGKTLMYTTSDPPEVVIQSLDSGERKVLLEGEAARYLPTGYILYGSGNALFVVPFDPNSLEITGSKIQMVERVAGFFGTLQYAVSDSGALAYIPGEPQQEAQNTLVWVNRGGAEEPLAAPPRQYVNPHISPDGTRIVCNIWNPQDENEIYIWDLTRENLMRLTFSDEKNLLLPVWNPDGKRVLFYSSRQGTAGGLYWMAADGSGEIEEFYSAPKTPLYPQSLSSDGKTLFLVETSDEGGIDISALSMEGDHTRRPLLHEKYMEHQPQISPDGKWLAYTSAESGRVEVYVRPFPEVNKSKEKASIDGGDSPLWSPDGSELFYRNGNSVMAVAVETESTLRLQKPAMLFQGSYNGFLSIFVLNHPWDIHPDGKRFLMIKPPESSSDEASEQNRKINIVLNWFEELKERVPAD